MRALPLFHRIAGQPVVVLGEGAAADAKRRLVERAGGQLVDAMVGGARLAFVAYGEPGADEAAAARLRASGLLVNVADRPDLCDFTVPSVLDREPVLVAVGTGGASAGLAKQLRLRLERVLPADLGRLAHALLAARARLRQHWPEGAARRNALDAALAEGGALDPLREGGAARVDAWLAQAPIAAGAGGPVELLITSDDPDDLTLRQARLLGLADAVMFSPAVPSAILDRARADAVRLPLGAQGPLPAGLVVILRRA